MHTYRSTSVEIRSRPALMPETPIVSVVDADPSVRQSLTMLTGTAGWRAETFPSAQEYLRRPQAIVPNCLILDVHLPDLNGMDLRKLTSERYNTPVICITARIDVPMTVTAMKAGAVEFLTKPFRDDIMLLAIGHALDRSRAAIELESEMLDLQGRHIALSPREQEVMALVVAGLMNKQIAFELGISEITVKAHRGRVMQKMRARSLADLVIMGAKLGLITASGARRTQTAPMTQGFPWFGAGIWSGPTALA